MKAKKLLAGLLSAAMVLSLTACGGEEKEASAAAAETAAETAETTEETAEASGETTEAAVDSGESGENAGNTPATGELVDYETGLATVIGSLDLNPEDFADMEPRTFTVTASASSANFGYDMMVGIAEAVTEQTGGKIEFNIVWDGALGNDNELTESVQAGNIDMVFEATSSLSSYVPESAVFDMPGLFTNCEEATEACRAFLDTWNECLAEYNLYALDLTCPLFRGLSCNREINSPEDFSGLSIRCAENKYNQAFYTNLGMSPTPLPFNELYMALQQGLVDGQDNPISVVYASKFHEVQSCYMDLYAISYASNLLINKELYDGLDPAVQDALTQFAVQFYNSELLCQPYSDQEAINDMGDGMTIMPVTDEIQAAITAASEPVWEMVSEDIGQEVVDQFLACAGR